MASLLHWSSHWIYSWADVAMKIFLAGPVDYWWNENWESPQHIQYMKWRDYISKLMVEAGHLVYHPHRAWKGAWDESAQAVNDAALDVCDEFVYLTPLDVPAYGTMAEKIKFQSSGKPCHHAPPGSTEQIKHLIQRLDNPYSSVYRKSYSEPGKSPA